VLTEEQRAKLGPAKPKIVALSTGNLAQTISLRHLFQAGLLHAAIVSNPTLPKDKAVAPRKTFDQLYYVLRAGELGKLALISRQRQ
jgi:hypothetical protein